MPERASEQSSPGPAEKRTAWPRPPGTDRLAQTTWPGPPGTDRLAQTRKGPTQSRSTGSFVPGRRVAEGFRRELLASAAKVAEDQAVFATSPLLVSLLLCLGEPTSPPTRAGPSPTIQTIQGESGARAPAASPEGPAAASPSRSVTTSPFFEGRPLGPPFTAEMAQLDRRQHRIQTAGMATLTGWSIANIVGGVAGNLATPRGNPWRYAHQMNAMWNTVNLTLGAIGLASVRRARSQVGQRFYVRENVAKTQRIFAVNALLDVAYMLGGVITWEIGKDRESPRLIGYGASIIGQGAFLTLFDLAMVSAHERGLRRSLPGYSIGAMPTPGGAAMSLGGAF